jgi:hypothetical protein
MAPKTKSGNGVSSKKQQQIIPGTEHPDDVEAIDDAMADFLTARANLLRMKQETNSLKAGVLSLMQEHKRERYVFRDGAYRYTVTADGTVELHVKRESEGEKKRGKAKAVAGPLDSDA